MGLRQFECVCLVTSPTRMKGLLKRWGSKGTARFRMRSAKLASLGSTQLQSEEVNALADQDFSDLEREEDAYEQSIATVRSGIEVGLPVAVVPREFLPNFNFSMAKAVVVVGQDGLVANTAKYVGGVPIIGINPDPSRFDGVLLPFQAADARRTLQRVLKDAASFRTVTMGQADLNDGQSLLAFNDFFVGCLSHASARYRIQQGQQSEVHSSSGVIVSTGAGSTGWLSSVVNMVRGISVDSDSRTYPIHPMTWEDRQLAWVVREPFKSKASSADMVAGMVNEPGKLLIESLMPERGVIFSDGIESDAIEFNSGSTVKIKVSNQVARLVVR